MRPLTFLSPLVIFGILGSSFLFAYALTREEAAKVKVTIPEGATVAEVNALLEQKGVLAEDLPGGLEGYLFPDTYEFFVSSSPEVVSTKFEENFNRKVRPLLPPDTSEADLKKILVKASLIEREVPDSSDRKIVAGIMEKRLKTNIPLQMDASLCYGKPSPCLPQAADKGIRSPWNTYLYTGLPPGPIANPGLDAIISAMNPVASPYWYYLSDPRTGKTVFSKTLDEHNTNIVKYLNTAN